MPRCKYCGVTIKTFSTGPGGAPEWFHNTSGSGLNESWRYCQVTAAEPEVEGQEDLPAFTGITTIKDLRTGDHRFDEPETGVPVHAAVQPNEDGSEYISVISIPGFNRCKECGHFIQGTIISSNSWVSGMNYPCGHMAESVSYDSYLKE